MHIFLNDADFYLQNYPLSPEVPLLGLAFLSPYRYIFNVLTYIIYYTNMYVNPPTFIFSLYWWTYYKTGTAIIFPFVNWAPDIKNWALTLWGGSATFISSISLTSLLYPGRGMAAGTLLRLRLLIFSNLLKY